MSQSGHGIMNALFQRFATRWTLPVKTVEEIFRLAQDRGYGKARRVIINVWRLNQAQVPSVRQIRYMVRVVNLSRRFGTDASNYRDIVLRRS